MYPLPTLDFLPSSPFAHPVNIFLLLLGSFPFPSPTIPLNFLKRLRSHSAQFLLQLYNSLPQFLLLHLCKHTCCIMLSYELYFLRHYFFKICASFSRKATS